MKTEETDSEYWERRAAYGGGVHTPATLILGVMDHLWRLSYSGYFLRLERQSLRYRGNTWVTEFPLLTRLLMS